MPGGSLSPRLPSDAIGRPLAELLRLGLVRGKISTRTLERVLSNGKIGSAEFDLFLQLAASLGIPIRRVGNGSAPPAEHRVNGRNTGKVDGGHSEGPPLSGLQIYFRALRNCAPLTPEEERRVSREARKGDHRSRNEMIRSNLRLVVFHARRYQGRGVSLDDLIEEGNLGLFRAVERFDPERGFRFSTYASWWIRHALGQAVAHHGRTVRVPLDFLRRLHHLLEAERVVTQKLGRSPTETELADHLTTTVKSVRRLLSMRDGTLSLDASSPGDDDQSPFIRNLPSGDDLTGEVERRRQLAELESWISELPSTQRAILRARFGFATGQPQTLAQVSRLIGRSRERVRQLEKRALRFLRERALAPGNGVGKHGRDGPGRDEAGRGWTSREEEAPARMSA